MNLDQDVRTRTKPEQNQNQEPKQNQHQASIIEGKISSLLLINLTRTRSMITDEITVIPNEQESFNFMK